MTDENVVDPRIVELEAKVKTQELKLHALEVEKRESKIRTHKADFKAEGKSIEFLDGIVFAMENMNLKQHNVAEVVPKEKIAHVHKVGETIDEDNYDEKGASDL